VTFEILNELACSRIPQLDQLVRRYRQHQEKGLHAEARYFPSGLNLTELTAFLWPRRRYRRRYCLSSGRVSTGSEDTSGLESCCVSASGAGCSSLIRLFGDSIVNSGSLQKLRPPLRMGFHTKPQCGACLKQKPKGQSDRQFRQIVQVGDVGL
jgi:hypothetical protein